MFEPGAILQMALENEEYFPAEMQTEMDVLIAEIRQADGDPAGLSPQLRALYQAMPSPKLHFLETALFGIRARR